MLCFLADQIKSWMKIINVLIPTIAQLVIAVKLNLWDKMRSKDREVKPDPSKEFISVVWTRNKVE